MGIRHTASHRLADGSGYHVVHGLVVATQWTIRLRLPPLLQSRFQVLIKDKLYDGLRNTKIRGSNSSIEANNTLEEVDPIIRFHNNDWLHNIRECVGQVT